MVGGIHASDLGGDGLVYAGWTAGYNRGNAGVRGELIRRPGAKMPVCAASLQAPIAPRAGPRSGADFAGVCGPDARIGNAWDDWYWSLPKQE